MADETSPSTPQGGRPGGNREPGGFRIRLSDNEMRAARALQEAFRLRSTVAVLGFALRTLAQMLEEGKLDELVAQQRAQGGGREGGRDGGRQRRGDGEGRGSRQERAPRVNPFARPARPAAAPEAVAEEAPLETEAAAADGATEAGEASSEAATEDNGAVTAEGLN